MLEDGRSVPILVLVVVVGYLHLVQPLLSSSWPVRTLQSVTLNGNVRTLQSVCVL